MASKRPRTKKPLLPSHTRPPTVKAKYATLSSKATRNLIRSHHRLLKRRAQALEAQDEVLVGKLDAQIQENGGLESYQLASRLGQSLERGGDSSKVLVDWISPQLSQLKDTDSKLRVLEVGALSTKNACSMNQYLDVTRIDLNSQEPGILKQDFMEMPLPHDATDQFHIISLSLVLNYVPDAIGRGEMLKRCVAFLKKPPLPGSFLSAPGLFLVLPIACVKNSRYLTESRLQDILSSMGFVLTKTKETTKLIFQLWEHSQEFELKSFKKDILRPGKTRNNFAIVVK
ncbi:putative methyltransferase-domain-containing protein [Aspergillus leporis]|jgi:25S rRNA (adenine2142-N1)-methyltransferase|uniref:25S rRNA adenine-N(1) methyltransferase n=1 Tax=Aspergillus leporis TaxID=41062 RepID=A0A5N5XBH4_9EURO|nr:putative methyltransferase-domain-containing protein [Aspergillus leporis]